MSNQNTKFGAKEVMDVTLYNMKTGEPFICFDTLKTSAISVTAEKVYARGGKGNPKLITWEFNKEATLTIEDALITPKSMELISGVAVDTSEQSVYMRQKTVWENGVDQGEFQPLKCSAAGEIELAYEPVGGETKVNIYLKDDDCGTKISMEGAALSGKVITLGEAGKTVAADKEIVAYYTRKASSSTQTYTITADKFAGTYKLVGDTVVRNAETGEDEPFQIIIPNLKWTSDLELGFSAEGEPATTSFECEIMRESNSSTMIKMIKYEN